jgi:hypothetical protein
MLSSSVDLLCSDDAFDALLNALLVVIFIGLGYWFFDTGALPLPVVRGVPFRTIYDVIERNYCKQVPIILYIQTMQ